jgi:CDP-paratose 2-epimerase
MSRNALVTGACGLIGSEVCLYLAHNGFRIFGLDNNQRAVFFGPEGDTSWSLERLRTNIPDYRHFKIDIRNRNGILELVSNVRPNAIIHTAAQPSHDRAAAIPFDDFDINAGGTLNLLEAARRFCPESPFVHMSTNKVYGDLPNSIPLRELETRWDYADPAFANGIIGASKYATISTPKMW